MELKLTGRTVLVTGASKGIGLCIAQWFAREGCNLRLAARSGGPKDFRRSGEPLLDGSTLPRAASFSARGHLDHACAAVDSGRTGSGEGPMTNRPAMNKAKRIARVGLIGLGKMGLPMSRHLLANGFKVTGFDVASAAARKGASMGVRIARSPAEVATRSDLVVVVVGFESEVDEAMFGPRGVMRAARSGLVVAVSSTVAPAYMRDIAARTRKSNVVLLDAPLCRGEPAAEKGRLQIMVGGTRAAFAACLPVFRSYSDSIHHLGRLGAGQVGKMVNNLILWACISANAEGLKLGAALGVAEEPLRKALIESSARNWALDTWLEQRTMPWAEKDMSIVLKEADEVRLSLPLCGAVKEVIKGIKIERGLPMPRTRS